MVDGALLHENAVLSKQVALLRAELAEREELLAERERFIAGLEAELARLTAELAKGSKDREQLLAQIQRLTQMRRRALDLAPGQDLFNFDGDVTPVVEIPAHVDEAPDGETEADSIRGRHKPKSRARRIDTTNLPVEHVHHELDPEQRVCPVTGNQLVVVDEVLEEELRFQPGQLTKVVHHRAVYGLSEEDAKERQAPPIVAPGPVRPIEGSIAGAALLAWILTSKYLLHLPLYRQEQDLERRGLRIPRQTLCDWVLRCAAELEPLATAQLRLIRAGPVLQLDDTPIRCQAGKGQGKFQAYLWTFTNPEVDGVAFRFTPGRAADLISTELDGFEGTLVGDGYSGNARAARKAPGNIVLAGCWAHVIRKFKDARAETPEAIRFYLDIKELFAIEKEADEAELDAEARCALRARRSRRVLARIFWQLRRWRDRHSEAGKMAAACKYLENQRKPLRRFLENGLVPIHNNRCENSIRPIAVGRRNWLFAGSERGGRAAAILYTLIESCRLAKVNPAAYLEDVLVRVASHPADRVAELLPAQWAQRFGPQAQSAELPASAAL